MEKLALLAAVLTSACADSTQDYFVLDYEDRSLGPGLEYTFMPMRIVCEAHQEFPYACQQRRVTVHQVSASGAGELRARGDGVFTVLGREPGTALVDLHAAVRDEDGETRLARAFHVPVVEIAYSQIGWYSNDSITALDGAAFRSSRVKVWQHHYREPRAQLVRALRSEIMAAELDGDAVFEVDPGPTSAALVVADGNARHATDISTGSVLGTATVHTTAGGAFSLDIVDETAIARLEVERNAQPSTVGSLVVKPFDAGDRPILGCPLPGPTVTDTAGAVVVASVDTTAWLTFCEIELAWLRSPIDTTVVVQWGGREARVVIGAP